MNAINTFDHAGCTVNIYPDTDPPNPRTDFDNADTMICFHRRYNLGDKHGFDSPADFEEWWEANGTGGVRLPLYLYDHSGITISTAPFSCPWDSGQVGYIYSDAETIKREWGGDIAAAEKYLRVDVETYDQYLTGQVYGYVVEHEESGEEDSCWGFYGLEYCESEARSVAESLAKSEAKETAKCAAITHN